MSISGQIDAIIQPCPEPGRFRVNHGMRNISSISGLSNGDQDLTFISNIAFDMNRGGKDTRAGCVLNFA